MDSTNHELKCWFASMDARPVDREGQLYTCPVPFHISNLRIHRFWYFRGSWSQQTMNTEGQLPPICSISGTNNFPEALSEYPVLPLPHLHIPLHPSSKQRNQHFSLQEPVFCISYYFLSGCPILYLLVS